MHISGGLYRANCDQLELRCVRVTVLQHVIRFRGATAAAQEQVAASMRRHIAAATITISTMEIESNGTGISIVTEAINA